MTTQSPAAPWAGPAPADRLERAAAALTAHGFTVETLDGVAAARARIQALIPAGASVFTGASETLRQSGIEADISTSGRYDALRPRVLAMDRATEADSIRRLLASPDVAVGSVHAVTETGSLVIASGSGSQLPGYAGARPARSGSWGRRRSCRTWRPGCGGWRSTACRWRARVPRRPTGRRVPSTGCSS